MLQSLGAAELRSELRAEAAESRTELRCGFGTVAAEPAGFALRLGLPPVSHWLTWLAKRSEQSVSCELLCSGATLTTMRVLPWPERQGSYVVNTPTSVREDGLVQRIQSTARVRGRRLQ